MAGGTVAPFTGWPPPRSTTRSAEPGPPPGAMDTGRERSHGHAVTRWQGARCRGLQQLPLWGSTVLRAGLRIAVRPDQRTWTATGKMVAVLADRYAATLLADGKVLVAGGQEISGNQGFGLGRAVRPAEWGVDRHREHDRNTYGGTVQRCCSDGRVLVAGGEVATPGWTDALRSAELYDPASGTWSATASMLATRADTRPRCCPMARCSCERVGSRDGDGVRRAVRPGQRKLKITRPICGAISGTQGRFGREWPVASILDGQPLETNS